MAGAQPLGMYIVSSVLFLIPCALLWVGWRRLIKGSKESEHPLGERTASMPRRLLRVLQDSQAWHSCFLGFLAEEVLAEWTHLPGSGNLLARLSNGR
jgi:hypothetical protein